MGIIGRAVRATLTLTINSTNRQVMGAAVLIGGCIPLLPAYALPEPVEIWEGVDAADLGNYFFMTASVLYDYTHAH